jgi:hypothetical protein
MHLFKTIKRIFDRDWLDPRSQFVGDGGAVDIGDLVSICAVCINALGRSRGARWSERREFKQLVEHVIVMMGSGVQISLAAPILN